jgi:hypothetical protein
MKQLIPFTLSVIAILSSIVSIAQTDTTASKDDIVIEGKKVKVIIKEKEVIKRSEDGKDSIVEKTIEKIELINKDNAETVEDFPEDEVYALEEDFNVFEEGEPEEDNTPPLVETDWFNMQLGLNNLLNADNKLEMPSGSEDLEIITGKSLDFQLHIVQQAINLYRGKVRFVYGVGIDFNNYRFSKDVNLVPDSKPLATTISTKDYKKNKLVTQYLTVPVLLDFEIGRGDDGVKLAFGPNFGYLIGCHQKLKWNERGTSKEKVRDDFNLEQFRMGYEVQFGYNNFTLYGRYFPNSIFKANQGPDVSSVSVGILLGHI